MDTPRKLSVKELKEELKKRGAKISGKKEELVQRLESYIRLQIKSSPSVTYAQGEDVLQFPSCIQFQDITTKDRDKILLTNIQLMDYFIFRKSEIDGAPVSNYRSLCDAGYRLFNEKYVLFIKCSHEPSGVFVCGNVKSEFTKFKSYFVKLILATAGHIIAAGCECVAGAGPSASCKHIAAVCYVLEHFSKTGEVKSDETCTQTLQTFHHPSSKKLKTSPIKMENLNVGGSQEPCHDVRPSSGINKEGYQQYVENLVKTSRLKLAFSFAIRKEKGSLFGVLHDHHYGVDPCTSQAKMLVSVTEDQRKEIEVQTREQSKQSLWFEERKYRLTASNFGKICHTKNPENMAKVLLNPNRFSSWNMKWGLQMEDLARQRYCEVTDHIVQKCGLIIHPTKHYLAASCDGLIGQDRVLELKGLPSHAHDMISPKSVPYLQENHEGVTLKKNHNHYYQVQGQLFITGRQYCSFVVYTCVDILVLDIERDNSFIHEIEEKLEYFYRNYYVPAIFE